MAASIYEMKRLEAGEGDAPALSGPDVSTLDSSAQVEPTGQVQGRSIAYTYSFGFGVPTSKMEGLLEAHRKACETAGAGTCFVVSSAISGLGQDYASARLELKAAPDWVARFRTGLQDGLSPFGAVLDSSETSSEDLTVQIIDTSVRLETNRSLRNRLQALLRDRPGKLADLLEIERELARVQGEIDSTESILTAMRSRVSMSSITLAYQPRYSPVSGSVWRPLGDAVSGVIPGLVGSLAAIVTFVSWAAPWVIALGLVFWLAWRGWGVVRRRTRRVPSSSAKGSGGSA
jgi:hypothetical protein